MLCNLPCRIVLIVMNSVSMLVGLILLVIGALMVWGQSVIQTLLNSFIGPMMKNFLQGQEPKQIAELVTRILTSTSPVGMALFVLGAIFVGISGFGYCGACCNMKILLYIYAALVGLLAIAVLITFSVYFAKKDFIAQKVVELFNQSVQAYVSMEKDNVDSLVVGLISPQLNCCGVTGGQDFVNSPNFAKTDVYNGQRYSNLKYPIPCCKMNNLYVMLDSTCPNNPTVDNCNFNVGCEKPLKLKFIEYMNYAAYGLVAAFILLVIVVLFALLTICIDVV